MDRDDKDSSLNLAGTFSPGRRSQAAVSEIKPSSDEYLLHPGSASSSLASVEGEMSEDENPPPLMLPSPPDTTNSNSTSSFLNLLYEMYGFQLQNSDAASIKELCDADVKSLQLQLGLANPEQKDTNKSPLISGKESNSKFQVDDTGKSTLFEVQEKYVYRLGAPTSAIQLQSEETLTYLNKGQLYSLVMESSAKVSEVKSMIYLVFRLEHVTERLLWQYWYNMQANPNQRAFDIDRKNCENADIIEDLGHNAFSVQWSPTRGQTKLVFCVNCLSTDFSAQKGVAGIPLHFLVDTYEDLDPSAEPVHRAVCKIKVFRDKGAERKVKDEIRSVERRMQKVNSKQQSPTSASGSGGGSSRPGPSDFQLPSKVTILTPTTTLGPYPFIFIPVSQDDSSSSVGSSKLATSALLQNIRERETKRGLSTSLLQAKDEFDNLDVNPPKKKANMSCKREVLVTVYVKKEEEKAYHAVMLNTLTAHDFKMELAKKYDIPMDMVANLYKKTKKGLIVNLVDEMVEQFKDEDDFIISVDFDNQKGNVDLCVHY